MTFLRFAHSSTDGVLE